MNKFACASYFSRMKGPLFFVALCVFASPSCKETDANNKSIPSIVGEENGGDFRGSMMGDEVKEVLAREADNVVYNMPDEITCRIPLEMKDSTFYEVSYNFDRGLLNAIKLDLYPGNEGGTQRLLAEFSEYYTRRYGQAELKENTKSWVARGSRGRDVIVSMQITDNESNPRLRITFIEKQ